MPPPKYIQAVCMRLLSPNGTAVPKREGRILAEVIVGRGVAHLDRAVLHGVGGLQARHDLARGEDLDLEPVVGRFGHRLGEGFRRAVDGVERFREARRQPPLELRHRLRDGGLGDGGRGGSEAGGLQELTTFHGEYLLNLSVARTAAARSARAPTQVRPAQAAAGLDPREPATVLRRADLPSLTCACACGS